MLEEGLMRRFGRCVVLVIAAMAISGLGAVCSVDGHAKTAAAKTTTKASAAQTKTVQKPKVVTPVVVVPKATPKTVATKAPDTATTVALGTTTASKKALAVTAATVTTPTLRPVIFAGGARVGNSGSSHGFGSVSAHNPQLAVHLALANP